MGSTEVMPIVKDDIAMSSEAVQSAEAKENKVSPDVSESGETMDDTAKDGSVPVEAGVGVETNLKTEPETAKSDAVESTDKEGDKDIVGDVDEDDDDDDDDEDAPSSSSLFRINSGLLPFPEKLMSLLDGDKMSDSMWWLPDGDSFCLVPVVFAERVLDKHFQGTKFESFTRKLNRWGFKRVAGQKVPANTIAYYNKNFLRGKPKLLKNMNGGKTKFISAREKRMRAQLKRDRDREQAVMIAAQQQALFSDPRSGNGLSSVGSMSSGSNGNLGLGGLDTVHLQSMLSHPTGMQASGDMRLSEQMFAAKQALAMQQQRDDLQLRLLRQGTGLTSIRDPASIAASNHFLAARNSLGLNNMIPQFSGSSLAGMQLSHLQQRSADISSMNGGDMSTEQLLLARQFMNGGGGSSGSLSSSVNQRLMSQGMGGSSFASNGLESGALSDEQLLKMTSGSEGSGARDQQLLQLYLMEQQRNMNGR